MSYSCNGSAQGCERERFGGCKWHEEKEGQEERQFPLRIVREDDEEEDDDT